MLNTLRLKCGFQCMCTQLPPQTCYYFMKKFVTYINVTFLNSLSVVQTPVHTLKQSDCDLRSCCCWFDIWNADWNKPQEETCQSINQLSLLLQVFGSLSLSSSSSFLFITYPVSLFPVVLFLQGPKTQVLFNLQVRVAELPQLRQSKYRFNAFLFGLLK